MSNDVLSMPHARATAAKGKGRAVGAKITTAGDAQAAPALQPVRIRMYRQGLGDCFLLRFLKTNGQPFHVVIDCGVIVGTPLRGNIMHDVVKDIAHETGGVVNILIVTHEHWDHLSGFIEARDVWDQIQVRDVWVAWTEDPDDELATRLRKERAQRKKDLEMKLTALAARPGLQLDANRANRLSALASFLGLSAAGTADGKGGVEAAFNYAKQRVDHPRFLRPGMLLDQDVPNALVYVLGPPTDEKLLRKSDPTTSKPEVYSEARRAFAFGTAGLSTDDSEAPFAPNVGQNVANDAEYDLRMRVLFPSIVGDGTDPAWRRLTSDDVGAAEQLAMALDGETNNTSLALAFELADGRVLLFPADAQVGNWLSWQSCRWRNGRKIDQLLENTVFYKVGHHGSHNATLKELGLEKMTHRDLMAAIPVNLAMAAKKRWRMPFPPLKNRLLEKTCGRVILADAKQTPPVPTDLTNVTETDRERFAKAVAASPLYIDFTL